MKIPYFQVDAFADRVFGGNPAGVCMLKTWLPDDLLQSIAAENGLPETAFVVPRGDEWELRWFTPKLEMDLCGHATLAPAYVIWERLGWDKSLIRFHSRAGVLNVTRNEDRIVLDFPSRPAQACAMPEGIVRGLGKKPVEIYKARDYLAVFESEAEVLALSPDMAELQSVDCLGIIATAPGDRSDFVSRFFAPRAGVPEDPVTGSAHCTLIPYWSSRLSKPTLHAFQRSPRGGELFCEDRGERVNIAGRAVIYFGGEINVVSA